MRGYSGFTLPEVNGTFNNWCGNCNALSDANGDGIWETTISIPSGTYEYKFSFDSWTGQENLSDAGGCTITNGTFSNRTLTVTSDVILNTVCWGLCSDCLSENTLVWNQVWSEEFEGTQLNSNNWSYEIGNSGWGNNELQNYTNSPSNIELSNGSLKITARNENSNGSDYSSARIISNNLQEVQYGKIEARIKAPIGQGIWPAFWMLGANYENVGWPQCGEIDIMEHINNESLTNGTMHWYNGTGHSYKGSSVPMIEQDFHVYGIIWDEVSVQFLLDSMPYYEFEYSNYQNATPIFTKPFFFLLNVAVGGNWPGNPDATTVFPATMEVDYIRLFKNTIQGIEPASNFKSIRVFPVPFNDHLSIQNLPQDVTWNVCVFSSIGQQLESITGNSTSLELDTHYWNQGMYFVQVKSTKADSRTFRILKN